MCAGLEDQKFTIPYIGWCVLNNVQRSGGEFNNCCTRTPRVKQILEPSLVADRPNHQKAGEQGNDMNFRNLVGRVISLGLLSSSAHLAAAAQSETDFRIVDVELQFEAGSDFYVPWESGTTIHSGAGYVHPFGASDYWCGVGYEEELAFPNLRENANWIINNSVDSNPLFCIYKTKDGGLPP